MFSKAPAKPSTLLKQTIEIHFPPVIADLVTQYIYPSDKNILKLLNEDQHNQVENSFDDFPESVFQDKLNEWKITNPRLYLYFLPLNKWTDNEVKQVSDEKISDHLSKAIYIKKLFVQNATQGFNFIRTSEEKQEAIYHLNLSGLKLNNNNDGRIHLSNIRIRNAEFENVRFYFSEFQHTDFSDLKVDYTDSNTHAAFIKSDLSYANLQSCHMVNAVIANSKLQYTNLRHANLSHTLFSQDCDLSNADLSDANLFSANLSFCKLKNTNLKGANLTNCYLSYADISDTDLRDIVFYNACVVHANFSGSNLCGADLRNARNIDKTNLKCTNLINAAEHFKPLVRYFFEIASNKGNSLWRREVNIYKLVQAFWITGAKNLNEFDQRVASVPKSMMKNFFGMKSAFSLCLEQVRGNFLDLEQGKKLCEGPVL